MGRQEHQLSKETRQQYIDLFRMHAFTLVENIDLFAVNTTREQLIEAFARFRLFSSEKVMRGSAEAKAKNERIRKYQITLFNHFMQKTRNRSRGSAEELRTNLICADTLARYLNQSATREATNVFERDFFYLYNPVFSKIIGDVRNEREKKARSFGSKFKNGHLFFFSRSNR